MTLDGFCDHTSGIPDDEIHQYYADLLRSADTALYGRITYQLMEFWRTVLEKCKISKSRPGGRSSGTQTTIGERRFCMQPELDCSFDET